MGLFVERAPTPEMKELARHVAALDSSSVTEQQLDGIAALATAAAKGGSVVVKPTRIVAAIAIAVALLGAGAYLVWLGDQIAIAEAMKTAANAAYTPPTIGIAAVGTSLITLGGAWSAALVTAILTEK